MFAKLARLARSPQGRRVMNQAVRYASSPKGKKQLAGARQRIAARRTKPR